MTLLCVALAMPLIGPPGMGEILLIVGVLFLLFGATKLPKLGKGLGEGIRNFKEGLKGDGEKKGEGDDAIRKADDKSGD